MNHLGDTNKMVDTPRMNSVAGHARGIVDAAIFAEGMKLERELNAANAKIKRLVEAGEKMFWTLDAEETGSVGKEMWRKAKEDKP